MKKQYIIYGDGNVFTVKETSDYIVVSTDIPFSYTQSGNIKLTIIDDSKGIFDHMQTAQMNEEAFENFSHELSKEDSFIHSL